MLRKDNLFDTIYFQKSRNRIMRGEDEKRELGGGGLSKNSEFGKIFWSLSGMTGHNANFCGRTAESAR